jgi:hypothetical protein
VIKTEAQTKAYENKDDLPTFAELDEIFLEAVIGNLYSNQRFKHLSRLQLGEL